MNDPMPERVAESILAAFACRWKFLLGGTLLLSLLLTSQAWSGAEEVLIAKVIDGDDKAIIVRTNSEAYLIEKGVGCLSLWRYEGKKVLIVSPGMFLGVGSTLNIPEIGQECRVWNSEPLGSWGTSASESSPGPKAQPRANALQHVQAALALLGYDPGPTDGVLGAKTTAALSAFQRDQAVAPVGTLSSETYLALASAVHQARPNDTQALQLAMSLLTLAKGIQPDRGESETARCEEGHWVSTVSSDGRIIVLENNSVWEVDTVDAVLTILWLPTQRVLACGSFMINLVNGKKVKVAQLR